MMVLKNKNNSMTVLKKNKKKQCDGSKKKPTKTSV